ncbi:MAG: hypothetical protein HY593_03105 [Candidatus Omnitrophica bacterium]|nr:hypothetical protein [Candidatus Omnitrophota bacterium]
MSRLGLGALSGTACPLRVGHSPHKLLLAVAVYKHAALFESHSAKTK